MLPDDKYQPLTQSNFPLQQQNVSLKNTFLYYLSYLFHSPADQTGYVEYFATLLSYMHLHMQKQ